jgi:hypothetical protein
VIVVLGSAIVFVTILKNSFIGIFICYSGIAYRSIIRHSVGLWEVLVPVRQVSPLSVATGTRFEKTNDVKKAKSNARTNKKG